MVSLPTYNDNVFSGGSAADEVSALLSDRNSPLWNRAVGAVAPPGSIFKVVVGSAALQAGVANANTTIVSTGQISLVSAFDPSVVYVFRDWAAHGALDFYQGIARSSDVYFYYLAGGYQDFRGLGVERLATYARAFGFGERLGIDLPAEAAGTLPDPAWKQATWQEPWFIGDTYNLGIGQGFLLVTPLQMVMAASAIANGGELLQPRVVREVVDASGEVVTPRRSGYPAVPVDPRHWPVRATCGSPSSRRHSDAGGGGGVRCRQDGDRGMPDR
jgi:penicillin-binding protein 2